MSVNNIELAKAEEGGLNLVVDGREVSAQVDKEIEDSPEVVRGNQDQSRANKLAEGTSVSPVANGMVMGPTLMSNAN